jgi:hypothetical protein
VISPDIDVDRETMAALDRALFVLITTIAHTSALKHHSEGGYGSGKWYTPEYDDDDDHAHWEMGGCASHMCPLTAFLVSVSVLVICVFRCFKVRCRCCPTLQRRSPRSATSGWLLSKCGKGCKKARNCSSEGRIQRARRASAEQAAIAIRPGNMAML